MTASAHIVCNSRGGPGSTATSGPRAHEQPRRCPTGSSTAAPTGTNACLRAPARIASSSNGIRRRSRETTAQIRSSNRVVHHRRPRPLRDDVRGQVVGRRAEPAAGHHEVVAGEEVERAAQVVRPVADHDDVGDDDAARPQRLRQPRPVGVPDDARQHLGAGDDDPRADRSARNSSTSGARPPTAASASSPDAPRTDRLAGVGSGIALGTDAQGHLAVAEIDPEALRAEGPGALAGSR